MDKAIYSVRRYFRDGSSEYIQRDVTIDEAVEAFGSCVDCGTSERVTVTNLNNIISLEWTFGKGITRKEPSRVGQLGQSKTTSAFDIILDT